MVSYLWRCPYSIYVAEEKKRERAVGPSQDIAMVCGHLIASLWRSSKGLSLCWVLWLECLDFYLCGLFGGFA